MADPIVVQLQDGRTVEFPAGFTPQRIEFELKRYEKSQAQEKKGLAAKAIDWLDTRFTNAAAAASDTPSPVGALAGLARDSLKPVENFVRRQVGAPERNAGLDVTPFSPSSGDVKDFVFNQLGRPEQNLPGRAGQVADAAVEGALLGAPFGLGAVVPSLISGAGSEIAGQLTEGTPYEPFARIGGGVVGGGLGSGVQGLARYGGQIARSTMDPFTLSGRDKIIGQTLNRAATDPRAASTAMGGYSPRVPGSQATAAQAANDPGLLAFENSLKGQVGAGGDFAVQTAKNNAARLQAADAIAPTVTAEQAGDTLRNAMQGRKDALTKLRSDAAGPMYEAAKVMDPAIAGKPILQYVMDQAANETGPIRNALKLAQSSLFVGEGQSRRLASSPAEFQAARRALDAQIAKLEPGSPIEAKLIGVRNQVDDALKSGPMFAMADRTFRQMSEPLRPFDKKYGPRVAKALETGPYDGPYTQPSQGIPDAFARRGATGMDEMLAATGLANQPVKHAMLGRYIDDFKSAVRTTADDPLQGKVLSAAEADRWWQGNKAAFAKVATKDQVKAMETLIDDFAIGGRRTTGVTGPLTAQNLASGNMLNTILRFPMLADSAAAKNVARPLQFLYRIPEDELRKRLIDVLHDPKVASALMVKASEGNAKILAPMLERAFQGAAANLPTVRGE